MKDYITRMIYLNENESKTIFSINIFYKVLIQLRSLDVLDLYIEIGRHDISAFFLL